MKKMKNDIMILSNDFREGGLKMDYMMQKIRKNKKKETFYKRGRQNNFNSEVWSPTNRLRNPKWL